MSYEIRAASTAEIVEGLRASREASAVSNLLTGFLGPEAWGQVAYLSMCERTGSATGLRILETSASLLSNGSIEVQGNSDYTPPFPEGIAGDFELNSAGTHICTVRLKRATPTQVGVYRFSIDDTILGSFDINAAVPTSYSFIVRLAVGSHTFRVHTHGVSFLFYSLTVFRIPERAPV